MDQKKPTTLATPPGASPPAQGDATQTRSRRRFGDGETIVMPLADILRSRDVKAFDAEAPKTPHASSDEDLNDRTLTRGKTEIISAPMIAPGPEVDIGGSATAVGQPPAHTVAARPALSPWTAPHSSPGAGQQASDESTRVALNPVVRPQGNPPKAPVVASSTASAASPQAKSIVTPVPAPKPVGSGSPAPNAKPVGERRQVVAFFGSKGGTGATVLATNVAHAYARDELKTCVVDLDLQMGDTLAAFALQSSLVMSDAIGAVTHGERIPEGRLPTHAGGVSVVSQVGSVEDLDRINAESLPRLIDSLRLDNHTVLIDGLRDFSDNALAILDAVDKVCLIVVQEVLAVRRARWIFSILRKLGFDPGDVVLVVNRFDPSSDIPVDSLKRMFEGAAIMEVASDTRVALQALNRGVPLQTLAPQQPITQGVYRLSRFLLGESVAAPVLTSAAKPVSFWGRLTGRGGTR